MKNRAYRIRLSSKGVEAFLSCHYRLGRLTHHFVAYGNTLFVALLLAEKIDVVEVVEALEHRTTRSFYGQVYYNVGMPDISQDIVHRLITKLLEAQSWHKKPRPGEVYLAAISIMAASDDEELYWAFERMHRLVGRDS